MSLWCEELSAPKRWETRRQGFCRGCSSDNPAGRCCDDIGRQQIYWRYSVEVENQVSRCRNSFFWRLSWRHELTYNVTDSSSHELSAKVNMHTSLLLLAVCLWNWFQLMGRAGLKRKECSCKMYVSVPWISWILHTSTTQIS